MGLEQIQAAAHRGVGEAPLVVMPVEGVQPGVQKEVQKGACIIVSSDQEVRMTGMMSRHAGS